MASIQAAKQDLTKGESMASNPRSEAFKPRLACRRPKIACCQVYVTLSSALLVSSDPLGLVEGGVPHDVMRQLDCELRQLAVTMLRL